MSHTPGPWVIDWAETGARWNVDDAKGDAVALAQQRSSSNRGDPERDANARLIAAAPDLLTALRDAAQVINAMWTKTLPPCFAPTLELINQINSAIAKAEGQS